MCQTGCFLSYLVLGPAGDKKRMVTAVLDAEQEGAEGCVKTHF